MTDVKKEQCSTVGNKFQIPILWPKRWVWGKLFMIKEKLHCMDANCTHFQSYKMVHNIRL